jgi:hypothetical protein
LGTAIQYIVADGGIHYELRPTYFLATQIGSLDDPAQHSPIWRSPYCASQLLHRACDAWAVAQFTKMNP